MHIDFAHSTAHCLFLAIVNGISARYRFINICMSGATEHMKGLKMIKEKNQRYHVIMSVGSQCMYDIVHAACMYMYMYMYMYMCVSVYLELIR